MDEMTRVQGLPMLLEAVAERMEGNVEGLNKELLLQSAKTIRDLEVVADIATTIVKTAPRRSKGAEKAMIPRSYLAGLSSALYNAGRDV
jgi:hypothetical protein